MGYTFAALQGTKRLEVMLRALRRPIRTVLVWQVGATALMALAALLAADTAHALSAAAGGAVSILAGLAAALVAALGSGSSPARVLAGALRAEAVKLAVALLLVWLVLTSYPGAAVGVFLGAFVVTMLIFSMAFFVREY